MKTGIIIALFSVLALSGCADQSTDVPSGTRIPRTVVYAPDPTPDTPRTMIYATIPPEYLADSAEYFARNGISGVMLGSIAGNQFTDIWQQPTRYTPDVPEGRVVGEENPLLQMCREMNRRCTEAGITHNAVRTVFSGTLPDWYDDAGWAQVIETHRQCAAFARSAGFEGLALDIEYVHEQYNLEYEVYQAPGYNRDGLHDQARRRGYELMSAMLDAFPDMVLWQLPEGVFGYGPLAGDLFAGFISAMSERNATGGYHLSTEGIYYNPSPFAVLEHYREVKHSVEQRLSAPADTALRAWWNCHGSFNLGVYPLGFYREIYDEKLNFLGYGGRAEIFGDSIVGPGADKAGSNYSANDFRRQVGAIRLLNQPFMWIYCHGSVLWRMTPEERAHYRGSGSDILPVADDLDEYFSVMREKRILNDPLYADQFAAVLERGEAPTYPGHAPVWHTIGPFPCRSPQEFMTAYPPEDTVNLSAAYPAYPGYEGESDTLRWRELLPDSTGYIDLKSGVSRKDTVLAYSTAQVTTEEPTLAYVHFGCNDYGAVFVNGRKLYERVEEGTAYIDGDMFAVNLPAGTSRFLVKTGDVGGSGWGFHLRLLNPQGRVIDGVRWSGN